MLDDPKDGTEAVGGPVHVKVVKNKVAAPLRQDEFDDDGSTRKLEIVNRHVGMGIKQNYLYGILRPARG